MNLVHIIVVTNLLHENLPIASLFRLRRVCSSFRNYIDSSEGCKIFILSQMKLKIRNQLPTWDSIFFSVTSRCRECCCSTRARYLFFRVCNICTSDPLGYRCLMTCKQVASNHNMSLSWTRKKLLSVTKCIKKGPKGELYFRKIDTRRVPYKSSLRVQ